MLLPVALRFISVPFARPMPFSCAFQEYIDATPSIPTYFMKPGPALLPLPSKSFSPKAILFHLMKGF
jgi:hypothetical protein